MYTVTWSVCLVCTAAYQFALWPFTEFNGEETVTHGLCSETCLAEYERRFLDAA